VDPAALDQIGMAAMRAALDALGQLDPDADGDIDVGMDAAETAEQDGRERATETAPEPADPATINEQESVAMGDTTPAVETAPQALTTAHIPALAEAISKGIADALRPATTETAPASGGEGGTAGNAPATESAPAGDEPLTAAQLQAMLKEHTDQVRREVVAQYGPRRRGLVSGGTVTTETAGGGTGEPAAPVKPLHEMDPDEFAAHAAGVIDQVLPG